MKTALRMMILALVVTLLVPYGVSAATPHREGIELSVSRGATIAHFELRLRGEKLVDGRNRSTQIYIHYIGAGTTPVVIDQWVALPGDADELEVSRDLGWGALNGTVQALDQTTNTTVAVEIHVDQFANAGANSAGSWYTRNATLQGSVTINGFVIDLGRPLNPFNSEQGYNFSDKKPN